MQIRAKDLSGSPGDEAVLLGDKTGPLQPPLLLQLSGIPWQWRPPCHAVTEQQHLSKIAAKLLDSPHSPSVQLSFLPGSAWGFFLCHSVHQLQILLLLSAKIG